MSLRRQSTVRVDLKRVYHRRPKESRKGDYGRVVIAGGSETYSGCLAFNALAALKTGADLAIIVAPRRAADIAAGYSPDLITVPCSTAFPEPRTVHEQLKGADALVIGSGVARTASAHNALLTIIRDCKVPIVADAETLHAIAKRPSICKGKEMLLTPNAGEYRVLSQASWPASARDRGLAVSRLAKQYKTTVIVKGADDYISDGARVHVDHEGSVYMTKGGYGDLLAGVAGSILARGLISFDAARIAAFLVGRAGKIASRRFAEGTLASDVLALLPSVIPVGRS